MQLLLLYKKQNNHNRVIESLVSQSGEDGILIF